MSDSTFKFIPEKPEPPDNAEVYAACIWIAAAVLFTGGATWIAYRLLHTRLSHMHGLKYDLVTACTFLGMLTILTAGTFVISRLQKRLFRSN